jgi:bifunctional non-homologous end joining protein LigD
VNIDGCTIELTNIEHQLWPGITKADLISYYNTVADYILPHIKNRPLSLHVKPYSPTAPGLYIKDMEGRQPECAAIFSTKRKHPAPGKRNIIDYLVCNNKAALLWIINLGCIDINPWSSTTIDSTHPDYIVIDLDPSDDDFKKVITTGQAAKQFFDKQKLKAFIKTSGKTGMHILVPCEGFKFGEGKQKGEARIIAENICDQIHQLVPDITTLTVSKNSRGDRVYVDPSQNDLADTIASAYSCRPYHLPTVSTPLEWKEVKNNLDPQQFTIKNVLQRIEKKGDLLKAVFDSKIKRSNSKVLKQFL